MERSRASVVRRAYRIAVADLRACYDDLGVVAGRGHYDDYWTRDAAFAWLAALRLGDSEIVGKHVAFLVSLQRDDGMISFLIRKYFGLFSIFGWKVRIKIRPKFLSHKAFFLSEVVDSNPFFVIGAAELLRTFSDANLSNELVPHVELALAWCLGRISPNGLAEEGLLAGWNDGVYKSGTTLLTNVLFYRAFKSWETFCFERELTLRPDFFGVAGHIRGALHREFFNGRHFIDWVDRTRHENFDANANFLAILWGVADEDQAEKIAAFALEHAFDPPMVRLAYPPYPRRRLEFSNRLFGQGGYASGDDMYWFDTACLFAMCLEKTGRGEEARKLLVDLAGLVIEHGGVYEVYERDKGSLRFRPVRRLIYRAEHPFARSAALFILACESLGSC